MVRAEGKPPKDNPRFVVTNLKPLPRHLYNRVYCGRGDIENRIKELHRTSCSDFLPNQLRALITAAVYVLMHEVRLAAKGTSFKRAQVSTLRDRLLKLGGLDRDLCTTHRCALAQGRTAPLRVASALLAPGRSTGVADASSNAFDLLAESRTDLDFVR